MPASSDAMWVIWWTIVQPDGSFQEVIHALIPDTVEDAETLAGAQRELAEQMAEVFIVPLMRKLHVLTTGAAQQLRGAHILGRAANEPQLRINAAKFNGPPIIGIPLARQVPRDENPDDG